MCTRYSTCTVVQYFIIDGMVSMVLDGLRRSLYAASWLAPCAPTVRYCGIGVTRTALLPATGQSSVAVQF